jgi:hypothetical protein
MPRHRQTPVGSPGDPYSYYARNRDKVLEKQRKKREDPVFREKQRKYCREYYNQNKQYIIERSKAKRLGLPFQSRVKNTVPRFSIVRKPVEILFT